MLPITVRGYVPSTLSHWHEKCTFFHRGMLSCVHGERKVKPFVNSEQFNPLSSENMQFIESELASRRSF